MASKEYINQILSQLFYDTRTGLRSQSKLYKLAKDEGITSDEVNEWLNSQPIHTRRKKAVVQFQTVIPDINSQLQIDLIDMQDYAEQNDGMSWILNCVDSFSKYLYSETLKKKTINDTADAFVRVLQRARKDKRNFNYVHCDDGPEFKNNTFISLLKSENIGIEFSPPYHPQSNGIVERTNRTLKTMLFKYFERYDTTRYIDVLQDIVGNYNSSIHSTTNMRPEDINALNEDKVMGEIIKKKENSNIKNEQFLQEGDYVRVLEDKTTFGKTYMGRFSRNVYKITRRTNGIEGLIYDSYRINGLKKTYLYSQLQKVDNPTEEEKSNKQAAQSSLDYDMMVGKSSKHLSQEMGISLEESRKLIRKTVKKQSSSDFVKQNLPEFKASESEYNKIEEKEKPHEIRRSTRSNRFTGNYKNITKVVPH